MASLHLSSRTAACSRSVQRAAFCAAPRPQQRRAVRVRPQSLADNVRNAISDLSAPARVAVINKLYGAPSRAVLEEVLADDFKMGEEGFERAFTKADYIGFVADVVLPAIPDFKWGHASNGEADEQGYAIVTVQATGHHTGAPLAMPGLPPLPPSGKHFCLEEEAQKVKVEGGRVTRIQVIPARGAGPRALYTALGGTMPPKSSPDSPPL